MKIWLQVHIDFKEMYQELSSKSYSRLLASTSCYHQAEPEVTTETAFRKDLKRAILPVKTSCIHTWGINGKLGVEGTVWWNIVEIIPLSAFYLKRKDGSTSVVGSSVPRTPHNAPLEIGFHSVFRGSVITVKLNPCGMSRLFRFVYMIRG